MRTEQNGWDAALTLIVLAHLAVAIVHGTAHQGAGVALSPAGDLFVLIVIIAGPLAGLVWRFFSDSAAGAWVIAATMAGALVFGLVNHFFIESSDHVMQVTGPWHGWFAATAALLAMTEAAGLTLGTWLGAGLARRTS